MRFVYIHTYIHTYISLSKGYGIRYYITLHACPMLFFPLCVLSFSRVAVSSHPQVELHGLKQKIFLLLRSTIPSPRERLNLCSLPLTIAFICRFHRSTASPIFEQQPPLPSLTLYSNVSPPNHLSKQKDKWILNGHWLLQETAFGG